MRLDLYAIGEALQKVEDDWTRIDAELDRTRIGRKDPFTAFLRGNMLSAYAYLDDLLARQVEPFSDDGIAALLELNNRVHYGTDGALMAEFASAIAANAGPTSGPLRRGTPSTRDAATTPTSWPPRHTYLSSANRSCSSKATTALGR
jgi:hypothetical protein